MAAYTQIPKPEPSMTPSPRYEPAADRLNRAGWRQVGVCSFRRGDWTISAEGDRAWIRNQKTLEEVSMPKTPASFGDHVYLEWLLMQPLRGKKVQDFAFGPLHDLAGSSVV